MKKTLTGFLLFVSLAAFSQKEKTENNSGYKIGVKVGYNYSSASNNTNFAKMQADGGFHVGGFFAGAFKNGMGYRSELLFSRQNMDVTKDNPKPEDVNTDYLVLPHLFTYGIAKIVQFQAGGTLSFLLNAKRTQHIGATGDQTSSITDFYNRLKYGVAAGVELHPLKGLLVSARYNLDLIQSYKQTTGGYPYNLSTTDFKSGVLQVSLGYIF